MPLYLHPLCFISGNSGGVSHLGEFLCQRGQLYVLLEMPQRGRVDFGVLHAVLLAVTHLSEVSAKMQGSTSTRVF